MRRSTFLIYLFVFAVVFAAHFGYHAWQEARVASQWVALDSVERPSAWARYAERQDFYLGYSYALAAAFTVFAVLFSLQQRRREVGGILGGVTLLGGLYAAGSIRIFISGRHQTDRRGDHDRFDRPQQFLYHSQIQTRMLCSSSRWRARLSGFACSQHEVAHSCGV
jgi:hypothetical protein